MDVSPNHPDYERLKDRATIAAPTGPPSPTGELLASFTRPSREGQDCELRLVLDEYEGHPYLSLRVWQREARRVLAHAAASGPAQRGQGRGRVLVRAIDQVDPRRTDSRGPIAPSPATRRAPAMGRGRIAAPAERASRRRVLSRPGEDPWPGVRPVVLTGASWYIGT